MRVVIDSNRVIASLIKKGVTREILFNKQFEFVAPSFLISELHKYKQEIIRKAKITEKEFKVLLSLIFEQIRIIPKEEYGKFVGKVRSEIKDVKDVSYLAVSIATKARGIWTHDPHFNEQKGIKIYTNIDMLELNRKKRIS